jgi:hypothetical protein
MGLAAPGFTLGFPLASQPVPVGLCSAGAQLAGPLAATILDDFLPFAAEDGPPFAAEDGAMFVSPFTPAFALLLLALGAMLSDAYSASTVFSGGFGMGVCWRRGLMDSIFNGAYPTLTHVPCGSCTVPS